MKTIAVAGLLCLTAVAAHAQTVGPVPAPVAPAAPLGSCSLVVENGAQYTETPLAGFDPAKTSVPLPVPGTASKASMVMCSRATIIPEITDYRVLAEMHLPLAIHAGSRTLFLGATGGHFQVGVQDGDVTPQEKTALQDRMDQMQAAMDAKPPAKK